MEYVPSDIAIEVFLFAASFLTILAVFANKASDQFGLPSLALFLGLGMVAGSEGIGGIAFSNPQTAYAIGSLALAIIIFDGGMRTSWASVRPILKPGISLSLLGVVVTASITALFSFYVFGLSWLEALLLGSIISSTDAAAVFNILRSHNLGLRGRVKQVLEFEAGSNDPPAIFLTLGILAVMGETISSGPLFFSGLLLKQIVIGAAGGFIGGRFVVWVINKSSLGSEGLYNVLALSLALFLFSGVALLGGSGFLAVYIAGLIVGNTELLRKISILRFHDGLAWIAQIGLFVVLGLLVFPSQLLSVWQEGLLLALFLMLVARPLSVFCTLSGFGFHWRERVFFSWVGLRGGAPIILATLPFTIGYGKAEFFFNLIFFVVLFSVLLQGTTIPFIANKLNLIEAMPKDVGDSDETDLLPSGYFAKEFEVRNEAFAQGKRLIDLGLPEEVFLTSINRNNRLLIPRGDTVFRANDRVRAILPATEEEEVLRIFSEYQA